MRMVAGFTVWKECWFQYVKNGENPVNQASLSISVRIEKCIANECWIPLKSVLITFLIFLSLKIKFRFISKKKIHSYSQIYNMTFPNRCIKWENKKKWVANISFKECQRDFWTKTFRLRIFTDLVVGFAVWTKCCMSSSAVSGVNGQNNELSLISIIVDDINSYCEINTDHLFVELIQFKICLL